MSFEKSELAYQYAYFAEIFDILLTDMGISNNSISKVIPLSSKTISRIRSTGHMSMDTFIILCKFLRINANLLLGLSLDPFPYDVKDPDSFYKRLNNIPTTYPNNIKPYTTSSADYISDNTLSIEYLIKLLDISPEDNFQIMMEKFNKIQTKILKEIVLYAKSNNQF